MVLVGVRSGFRGFQGILGGFQGSFRWVSKGVLSGLQELKGPSAGCQARFSGTSRRFRIFKVVSQVYVWIFEGVSGNSRRITEGFPGILGGFRGNFGWVSERF